MAVPVQLQFDTPEEPQDGFTGNLSTGGMFVQAKSPKPVGTLLRFELQLSEGEPIRGVGEVVWIRAHSLGPEAPSGMGVQFGHMVESNRARLKSAVFEALEGLGIAGVTEPAPRSSVRRPLESPESAQSSKSGLSPKRPDTEKATGARTASPPARKVESKASPPTKPDKKGVKPAQSSITGRTKLLLAILGLLVLLFLFVL